MGNELVRPIRTRVTKCVTCGASIHMPLDQDFEHAAFLRVVYQCQCPRSPRDIDPVIRIYTGAASAADHL